MKKVLTTAHLAVYHELNEWKRKMVSSDDRLSVMGELKRDFELLPVELGLIRQEAEKLLAIYQPSAIQAKVAKEKLDEADLTL